MVCLLGAASTAGYCPLNQLGSAHVVPSLYSLQLATTASLVAAAQESGERLDQYALQARLAPLQSVSWGADGVPVQLRHPAQLSDDACRDHYALQAGSGGGASGGEPAAPPRASKAPIGRCAALLAVSQPVSPALPLSQRTRTHRLLQERKQRLTAQLRARLAPFFAQGKEAFGAEVSCMFWRRWMW